MHEFRIKNVLYETKPRNSINISFLLRVFSFCLLFPPAPVMHSRLCSVSGGNYLITAPVYIRITPPGAFLLLLRFVSCFVFLFCTEKYNSCSSGFSFVRNKKIAVIKFLFLSQKITRYNSGEFRRFFRRIILLF